MMKETCQSFLCNIRAVLQAEATYSLTDYWQCSVVIQHSNSAIYMEWEDFTWLHNSISFIKWQGSVFPQDVWVEVFSAENQLYEYKKYVCAIRAEVLCASVVYGFIGCCFCAVGLLPSSCVICPSRKMFSLSYDCIIFENHAWSNYHNTNSPPCFGKIIVLYSWTNVLKCRLEMY